MKTYTANEELVEILKENSFFETSDTSDKKAGIKRFQLSRASLKAIVISDHNIIIYDAGIFQDSSVELTEDELMILILYFKLKTICLMELSQDLPFEFNKVMNRFANLQVELQINIHLDIKKQRISKIKKILEVYNTIQL